MKNIFSVYFKTLLIASAAANLFSQQITTPMNEKTSIVTEEYKMQIQLKGDVNGDGYSDVISSALLNNAVNIKYDFSIIEQL